MPVRRDTSRAATKVENGGPVAQRTSGRCRRHVLRLLEAETTDVTNRADQTTLVVGPVRLRTVFDERQSMTGRHGSHRIHVARVSEQMHDDDCFGTRRDPLLHRRRVHVVGPIDVGKNRNRALADDGNDRAHVRDGRSDDLVTGVEVECTESDVDSCRARRRRHSVGYAVSEGKPPFEFAHHLAVYAAEILRQQCFAKLFQLAVVERGPPSRGAGHQLLAHHIESCLSNL